MHPHIAKIPEHELIYNLLRVFFPTARIILYGSRARGDNTERSDIDIAIDAGEKQPLRVMGRARDVLNEGLNVPEKIDLIDFHRVSETLRQQVIQDGIEWTK
jgi:predicted nucleotidyltransferase